MVGKAGRSGRVAVGGPKVAVHVRLSEEEAEALERMVEDRQAAALAVGGSASSASVVRAVVRKTLIEEGYLRDSSAPKKGAK